jgi:polyisoprenoid-binding protein YceI
MTARYRLDANQSRFTVQAFATGMLSMFAHSPTFAVHDFTGSVTFDDDTIKGMRLEIVVNAASLQLVDKVTVADRGEIESRMRGEVLETATYPEITLRAGVVSVETITRGHYRVRLHGSLSLHGVTGDFHVDAELSILDDGIRLRGEFPLRLSDYRIKPVTALGGAIKLKDELKLSFDIAGLPEGS